MPLTPSQKSAAFRTRKAEQIARMEAALRDIAELPLCKLPPQPDEICMGITIGRGQAALIAQAALAKPTKEA